MSDFYHPYLVHFFSLPRKKKGFVLSHDLRTFSLWLPRPYAWMEHCSRRSLSGRRLFTSWQSRSGEQKRNWGPDIGLQSMPSKPYFFQICLISYCLQELWGLGGTLVFRAHPFSAKVFSLVLGPAMYAWSLSFQRLEICAEAIEVPGIE